MMFNVRVCAPTASEMRKHLPVCRGIVADDDDVAAVRIRELRVGVACAQTLWE